MCTPMDYYLALPIVHKDIMMKKLFGTGTLYLFTIIFFLIGDVQAGIPLWTFTPQGPTALSVATNGTATVTYTVTNQSRKKTKTLVMTPIQGITSSGTCSLPLGPQQSCTLILQIDGSALQANVIGGPKLCEQGSILQCYQPSQINSLNITLTSVPMTITTLAISTNSIVLATQGILIPLAGVSPAAVSQSRTLTLTNTGMETALNVSYTLSPALPAGTTIAPLSCGNIAPGQSCVLTIIPGATASGAVASAPTPSVISIQGSNTGVPVSANIVVLTYGNIYQGGYVFSIDDTTTTTGSVGGKVAALTDQAALAPPAIVWDSTPGCGGGACPLTNATSITNGLNTAGGNTFKVIQTLNPIATTTYAAGLCSATINGFNDWYLPAICEMGYDAISVCGLVGAPILQNIQSNLIAPGISNFNFTLPEYYWSSTEYSGPIIFPLNDVAWYQYFATGLLSTQGFLFKNSTFSVRCSRVFTP